MHTCSVKIALEAMVEGAQVTQAKPTISSEGVRGIKRRSQPIMGVNRRM